MGKLGLARHRRTVAILCWFDVIISAVFLFLALIKELSTRNGTKGDVDAVKFFLIGLTIGVTGLHSMRRENRILMIAYGIMLTMKIAIQIFILYMLLVFGIPQPYYIIPFVVIIGVQIYGVVSAYRLTGVFRKGSILPVTKFG